jgi:DNA repair protein RecO (recombination protein O)
MMEWRDQGILLSSRRHGESSAIIEVFTPGRGRHLGVVRGGGSRKIAPVLQPGAQLDLVWRARLEEHLGAFTVEPLQSRAAAVMGDRLALAGLNAVLALLSFTLPEREPHPPLYHRSLALLDLLGSSEHWVLAYLHWELALLDEMGFGLDLGACAVTGATEGLAYVSPRTGRAVTEAGAGEFRDRLLPLPACLQTLRRASPAELAEGLRTTGHFLERRLAPALGDRPLPEARRRLAELQARQR